jgi:NitT/TauT family transport system substrate-binding protein
MRKFFSAAVAAMIGCAVACHSPLKTTDGDTGLTRVTLQTDWYPQPEHGGFYTAVVKGFYRDEGLDVTIVPGGPFTVAGRQVAAGAAEFGLSSSDKTLESVADGQPLVAVAATMQRDPQGIMVRKDSPIRSFADLNGHAVAVKPGSTWFAYIVKRFKLDGVREIPATMSVANFVADRDYVQQVFATSEPFFAQKAGIETCVLLTSDAGYNPYRVMFTSHDYLKGHPEVVGKFVRASVRGWREYMRDPAAAHAVILKLNPALNPELMEFSWRALKDGHFVDGTEDGTENFGGMTAARWSAMYQQLLDLKVFTKTFDPGTAYTLQFVGRN